MDKAKVENTETEIKFRADVIQPEYTN